MVPLLAPLLGSMAASLLPATFGTGIATALGMSGAGAGLLAAAAPKAIGAGIGTLLAGGDMGEAAMNAVGFGAMGAMGGAGGGAAAAGGAPTSSLRPMMRPPGLGAAAPATVPTGAANAAASAAGPTQTAMDTMQLFRKVQGAMGGNQQTPNMAAPQPVQQSSGPRASDNPMLAGAPPSPASSISNTTVPSVGGPSAMPASVGIGSLPFRGQQPMGNDMMLAGMSPDQRNMASQYLRDQGMVGFV